MPTLNSFPDLGKHFQLMKIKDGLLALQPNGVMQIGIVHLVETGKLVEVVKEIKEKSFENPKYMADIIGEELLQLIKTV